jgi:hypothetical protein
LVCCVCDNVSYGDKAGFPAIEEYWEGVTANQPLSEIQHNMVIENIKKLIASGDTKAGLELIMSSLSFDSESANDFILLNSRYVGIESLNRFGLINSDQTNYILLTRIKKLKKQSCYS